jgi:DNA-binding NtrC family response regulator
VVVECAGVSAALLEDELFGHVRGAFSGAVEERLGVLEAAGGGTLLLDEVADLPLVLQAKFLGALERRKITRLGSASSRRIDVRVLASSQRVLAREVNEGRFRADLFYRLAVVRLRVPPLRERPEDIPLLCGELLDAARARGLADVPPALSAAALARLRVQPWPGNVRELRNTLERTLQHLPGDAADEPAPAAKSGHFFSERQAALLEFERAYFRRQLALHPGNLSAVARATGLDRSYLARILKRLALTPSDQSRS